VYSKLLFELKASFSMLLPGLVLPPHESQDHLLSVVS